MVKKSGLGRMDYAYADMMAYEAKARENEAFVTGGIVNKFPNDKQKGRLLSYIIREGKIIIPNGVRNVDFVIDSTGSLCVGYGHSFLGRGKVVFAAGTIKINRNGQIRLITNESGHYQPTVKETITYINRLKKMGLAIDNAWIKISAFSTTKSNYVNSIKTVYNGPVKYMNRRMKNEGY